MAKFLIIDGTALVFRGFYGIPSLKTSDGKQINAIFGFFTILLRLLAEENPSHLAICFDRKEETSRKKEYSEYKATRAKVPDELIAQFDPIKNILSECEFNLVEKAGVEADDLIATIAVKNEATEGMQVLIFSSDLDLIQLVNDIKVLKSGNARIGNTLLDVKAVKEKYGFTPDFIPDYKGLHGDSSDNLPGIKGVGEKTASKLIQEYGKLENIYENLDKISGSLKQKLIDGKEQAFFCRKLATLHTDIEIETNPQKYLIQNIDFNKIEENFSKLEFKNLIQKFRQLEKKMEKVKRATEQQSLF